MLTYTLEQPARLLDPAHHGDSDMLIRGVSSLEEATGTTVAFAEDAKLLDKVMASAAAVVLVPKDFPDTGNRLVWRIDKPRIAFLKITELFAGKPAFTGIHERASIDASATLGAKVSVDACAVIAKGAMIGDGSRIGAGAFIGEGVVLGRDCIIEANATVLPGAILGNRVVVKRTQNDRRRHTRGRRLSPAARAETPSVPASPSTTAGPGDALNRMRSSS